MSALFLGNSEHLLCLGSIHCHRLFADNVLARIKGGNGALSVSRIPSADTYNINLGQCLKHFILIEEATLLGNVVFFRHIFKLFFIDIAESVKLNVGIFNITVDVLV